MKIAFIGDIVGRPGRRIIEEKLKTLKIEHNIDFVIANGENASHGFGLTVKNANELFSAGIDVFTGGNHSFDKKNEMINLLETQNVLRPHNLEEGTVGTGVKIFEINKEKLAVINLMGEYCMPKCDNPFNMATSLVKSLKEEGINNIFVDFHAEVTSEKRVMCMLLQGEISALCGTHTHVGTDDLQVVEGTTYLSDIGLTGCRDNVIGMDKKVPILKATQGKGKHFDIPKSCKTILQMLIIDLEVGKTKKAFKVKVYCDKKEVIITEAIYE